jgi:DNA-binding IclR family transcriptional regulator
MGTREHDDLSRAVPAACRAAVLAELQRIDREGADYLTTRELAARIGFALATTHAAVRQLVDEGLAAHHSGWGLPR